MRTKANGWQYFVATLLIIVGALNILQGLAAAFTPDLYVTAGGQVLVLEYGVWGLLLGIWGAVMVIAGIAVLSGSTWARAFGVVLAALNALAQIVFLVTMPLWSVVAIAINVLVIYGLTAGWPSEISGEQRRGRHESVYRSGYKAAHEQPSKAPRPTESPERSGQRQQPAG